MKQLSIRLRITLWNSVAFAVILLGFGLAVYGLLRKTHYDQVHRSLNAHLRNIVDKHPPSADADAQYRLTGVRGFSAYIVDTNGHVVEHTADLTPADMEIVASSQSGSPRFDSAQLPQVGHVRRLTAPVTNADPAQTVVVLAELEHVDEELWEVIRALLITTPITLIAAASIAYFLAYKALSPVDDLRRMTDEITAERLHRRLPVVNAADELGLLAQTINSMIARLERSFSEIRRFTADASHELRTPVTVIRSEAELGLADVAGNDRATRRLESIVEECSRLAELTTQLLTLCREEAGLAQLVRNPVALRVVISDVLDCIRPMAEARQQNLAVDLQDDITVVGDAARLHQVFTNLLQNAIKYTPAGGTITVCLRQQDEQALTTIQDTGIGIPAEHLPHVFDRFYQVETGRSHTEGGAGLGLSIAKSIVEVHGGQIDVTSQPGVGSVFRVVLAFARKESGHDKPRHVGSARESTAESALAQHEH